MAKISGAESHSFSVGMRLKPSTNQIWELLSYKLGISKTAVFELLIHEKAVELGLLEAKKDEVFPSLTATSVSREAEGERSLIIKLHGSRPDFVTIMSHELAHAVDGLIKHIETIYQIDPKPVDTASEPNEETGPTGSEGERADLHINRKSQGVTNRTQTGGVDTSYPVS